MIDGSHCKHDTVGKIDQGLLGFWLGLELEQIGTESDAVGMCFHAWQHEAGSVYCAFHEAINCVLEFFSGN